MLWVAANLLAVAWCFGAAGLALAASSVGARRPSVWSASLRSFLYLLHFAAASWAPVRPFALASPFHYYEGMRTVIGIHNPRPDIVALLAASLVLSGCAYALYGRRDLCEALGVVCTSAGFRPAQRVVTYRSALNARYISVLWRSMRSTVAAPGWSAAAACFNSSTPAIALPFSA